MKHSEVRQNIIETASFLFYKNGYNLTGINEIISEAGIAKATLYNHFKSKDDICLAYLQFKNGTFLNDIETFCTSKSKGESQLLAVFDFLSLFFKDRDFNGCWCIKTVSEIPKENEKIRKEIQYQKNKFIELLEKLTVDNLPEKSKKETTSIARQIYLLYESAVAESHLHQADWPISSTKQLARHILE